MQGIAITQRGLEKLSKQEIKDILGTEAVTSEMALTFDIDKELDLCKLAYKSRLLKHVMFKIGSFKIESAEDLEKLIKSDDFKRWIPKDKTFAVSCVREGDHMFSSNEVEVTVGEIIHEKLGISANLKSPDVIILAYVIEDTCHVGIDFSGFDLSKRSYRVFSLGEPLKGTVAHAMNLFSGMKEGDTFLDPFSSSGVLPIEAALYASGKSVHFYEKDDFAFCKLPFFKDVDFDDFFESEDKLSETKSVINCSGNLQKNIRSAEKNAKVAGVNKMLSFSRMDIEWLDTKHEEKHIDHIVAFPPQISKRTNESQIVKLIDELLYVSNIILADDGSIVLIFSQPDKLEASLKKHKFKIVDELEVWQGHEHIRIIKILRA